MKGFCSVFPCVASKETAPLHRELDEASRARKQAEEVEGASKKQLEAVLSSKCDLEAALQQEREACYSLHNDLEENKDHRGLLQCDLDAAEKKLTQQADVAREADQKVARLRRESEEVATQLAEAQQNYQNSEAVAKGACLRIAMSAL